MSGNKIIYGDNFETDGGKQYIAKDNATLTVNEGQQVPVEELLTLLNEVKQKLATLPVSQEVKEDVGARSMVRCGRCNGIRRTARRSWTVCGKQQPFFWKARRLSRRLWLWATCWGKA
ncbi:MAG: hypothetical protein V8K32_10865 [Candidatus Electrothrix gigas]